MRKEGLKKSLIGVLSGVAIVGGSKLVYDNREKIKKVKEEVKVKLSSRSNVVLEDVNNEEPKQQD